MPRTSDMLPSKFLKGSDVGVGKLVTFESVSRQNVGKEEDPEWKYAAHFKELEKPMILNKTNIRRLEKIFGSDDTDKWVGQQCVVYFDPDVEFGGELVGGIRVRAKKVEAEKDLPF